MNKKEKQFEKEWEEKYTQVCLDPEIYGFGEGRTFYILTPKEIEVIHEKTEERIKEYDRIKPQGWAGYD